MVITRRQAAPHDLVFEVELSPNPNSKMVSEPIIDLLLGHTLPYHSGHAPSVPILGVEGCLLLVPHERKRWLDYWL